MSARFDVSSFELVQAAPGTALLRIVGRWTGPVRERLAPPMLVVDDGHRTHRLSALPGPDDASPLAGPDAPPWRAAFAAPAALLTPRAAFALDAGRDRLLDLPRPGQRARPAPAVVTPRAAPTPDADLARRVAHERERLAAAEQARERAAREQQARHEAEERDRAARRAAHEQFLAAERARDEAAAAQRARAEADRARAQELREAANRREAEARAAEAQRLLEHEREQARLAAEAQRARAAHDAAAQRAAELERRIEGYRDMLAQATEALAVANGRIEADATQLSDALDHAAAQAAQREQAEADAEDARTRLAELETEHERTLMRASAAQSDLEIERDRVAELEETVDASQRHIDRLREQARTAPARSADARELETLRERAERAEHDRAVAARLRAAYSQESAARDAEVVAWHAECQAALARAAQLADALADARAELERVNDGDSLRVGSGRFARDD